MLEVANAIVNLGEEEEMSAKSIAFMLLKTEALLLILSSVNMVILKWIHVNVGKTNGKHYMHYNNIFLGTNGQLYILSSYCITEQQLVDIQALVSKNFYNASIGLLGVGAFLALIIYPCAKRNEACCRARNNANPCAINWPAPGEDTCGRIMYVEFL